MPAKLETNSVPGTCAWCGEIVRRGEGLMNGRHTKWRVWHLACVKARPATEEDEGSMKKTKKCPAKKPRTLNAVWGDAKCWIYPDPQTEYPHRIIQVQVGTALLTTKQALRLSKWLAEAAAWKAEE